MTAQRPRALVSWSSGKDSAWALHEARRRGDVEIAGLLTTVTAGYSRVSMHGVREQILEAQAEQAGLPLERVTIPPGASNAEYESAFLKAVAAARSNGVERIMFGDLFLRDIREYRERLLRATGVTPEFPLWGRNTRSLAHEMLAAGLEAIVVCVDPGRVPPKLAGLAFDEKLLASLPAGVDPCGENGEFHTCVLAGPVFAARVPARAGRRVEREGFVFADLVLDTPAAASAG